MRPKSLDDYKSSSSRATPVGNASQMVYVPTPGHNKV